MQKGYGLFFYECGTRQPRECNICGAMMQVEKYNGPISWTGAMARKSIKCDKFVCPYIKEEWHETAVDIVVESGKTKSPTLKEILLKDAEKIARRGKALKDYEIKIELVTRGLISERQAKKAVKKVLKAFDFDADQEIAKR